MKLFCNSVCLLAATFASMTSEAALYEVEFTGSLTDVPSEFSSTDFVQGNSFQASFIVDTTTADISPDAVSGFFPSSIISFSFESGIASFSLDPATAASTIFTTDNPVVNEDRLLMGTGTYDPVSVVGNIGNSNRVSALAELIDSDGTPDALSNDSILESLSSLNSFNDREIRVFVDLDNDTDTPSDFFTATIQSASVEVVPEPSSLALLALGGLALTRRRSR